MSTDEGLHLEFNSIHAQQEACEAYVKSQQHEGWVLSRDRYEDGGYSGGTLERPALKRLLENVSAGKVDTIVVYKIDRLTRSLADFSRIVDVLDRSKASFVSVTQAFNTTTSMGRLTLNVLLSFAQFEREIGAERVRDKIAASKKKGMWMGGVCPLGYDVKDRKLIVNEAEARTVRTIFRLYLRLGSVLLLETELSRRGMVSKLRTPSAGTVRVGTTLKRGSLYTMLQNRIYIGQICHRGAAYPGQHDAIVNESVFAAAQALLARNRSYRRQAADFRHLALLSGLVWDGCGRRMSPTHTVKGPARYRYYATKPAPVDPRPPTRVAAAELEHLVVERVAGFLRDRSALFDAVDLFQADAVALEAIRFAAGGAEQRLLSGTKTETRALVLQLIRRIDVLPDEVRVNIRPGVLLEMAELAAPQTSEMPGLELSVPVRMYRRAREVRLAISPGAALNAPARDPALIKLIVKAWAARTALLGGGGASLQEIAAASGFEPGYFAVLVKLGFLAPDIIEDILAGKQPSKLTRQQLARLRGLPMEWATQRILLASEQLS